MIRAAALSYAIVFVLLVGLVCSGILFISGTQKRLETIHLQKERLLFDSYSAIQMAKTQLGNADTSTYDHGNGNTSTVKQTVWGAFSLITSETKHIDKTRNRAALLGRADQEEYPCLYLSGKNNNLKVCGATRIEGKAYVPNKRVERAYIAGKNYEYEELVFGEILQAEGKLPSIQTSASNLTLADFSQNSFKQDYLPKDSNYSFFYPTTFYSSNSSLVIQNSISGNVVIHSPDSILVSPKAKLENVILIAPSVQFLSGFSGTIQVLAHESIVLNSDVCLRYPSALILNELENCSPNSVRRIVLEEESQLYGGILITSQKKDFRRPPRLDLSPNTVIGGLVYVEGETSPKGKIIGSLFTENIKLQVGGGAYSNHLLDALISSDRLPSDFIYPNWLSSQDASKLKVIDWLL